MKRSVGAIAKRKKKLNCSLSLTAKLKPEGFS